MRVVDLRQPVVADRLRRIQRALQRTQQADLQHVFLRMTAHLREQLLNFRAQRQVADLDVEARDEVAVILQLRRVGVLVNAIDAGDPTQRRLNPCRKSS